MALDTNANVPDFSVSVIDQNTGRIDPVWYQFFLKLLIRTGGENGSDSAALRKAIKSLEGLNASQVGIAAASAALRDLALGTQAVYVPPKTQPTNLGDVPAHGLQVDEQLHAVVTAALAGFMSAADKVKLDGVTAGAAVVSVSGTAPIASTGGSMPVISIAAASGSAAGSMSASDKTKLDGIGSGAAVTGVTGTAPIVSSGGTAPAISIAAATSSVPGSMSAADKTILDAMSTGGTFTPTLSCATPGNLNVVYSQRSGSYTKIGRQVFISFTIITSTFTWTTASGQLQLSGLPFTSNVPFQAVGSLDWGGITKTGYTQIVPVVVTGNTTMLLLGNGSGLIRSVITIADLPSGGSVVLSGQISYFV
jgi:hypothetical protein